MTPLAPAVGSADDSAGCPHFTRPTDGPAKGTVRAGFLGRDKIGSAITRADIATFLLDQLVDTRFIRAAPAIRN